MREGAQRTIFYFQEASKEGKPGKPGHRNIGKSFLVGPPGRMVSNAGQQQWYEGGHVEFA
jgi:hypothetical protein